MKTKLIIREENSIIGYNNIKYDQLNELDNNSLFELYIDNEILKAIPNKNFYSFIEICSSKIRLGGKLIVTGRDIMKISLCYIHRYINEEDLSELLSGNFGFYNCRIVEEAIKSNNLKIHSMFIDGNDFIVRGIRE